MNHVARPVIVSALAVLIAICGVVTSKAQDVAPPEVGGMHVAPAIDTAFGMSDFRVAPDRPAWHSMVTNVPRDFAALPARVFQPSGMTTVAGLGVLTAALVLSDGHTYGATRRSLDRNPSAQRACNAMVYAGDGRIHLGVAAAFGIVGFVADDSRALRTASQTVEALLATGLTVQVLKRMAGRESPAVATIDGGMWRLFPSAREYNHHQSRYYAFPSGHIATTMSTVTVIAENYPDTWWIRPAGYGIVGLLGVSLVGVDYHWYSDFPLGIALGYTFGSIVSRRDSGSNGAKEGESNYSLSIVPMVGRSGTGIALAMSF